METSQKNAKKGFKFGAHVSKYIIALDPTKCLLTIIYALRQMDILPLTHTHTHTNVRKLLLSFSKDFLIVLGFNDTSTLVGHFVSSPREREKRDRRDSRGDERDD